MHAAFPSETQFGPALDFIEIGRQVVRVERVMQNGKRLRAETLRAHLCVSVADGDIRCGDISGSEDVRRQAEGSDRVEVLEILPDTFGEGEASGESVSDVQNKR